MSDNNFMFFKMSKEHYNEINRMIKRIIKDRKTKREYLRKKTGYSEGLIRPVPELISITPNDIPANVPANPPPSPTPSTASTMTDSSSVMGGCREDDDKYDKLLEVIEGLRSDLDYGIGAIKDLLRYIETLCRKYRQEPPPISHDLQEFIDKNSGHN